MATNPTKDPLEFLEQQLKNAEMHLYAAENRLANAKVKREEKRKRLAEKGKELKTPELGDDNSEIRNLKVKINNINYCIEAVKEKKARDNIKEDLFNINKTRNV